VEPALGDPDRSHQRHDRDRDHDDDSVLDAVLPAKPALDRGRPVRAGRLDGLPAERRPDGTVYGKTSSYSTSYQITDSAGNCLQPTDPTVTSPDLYLGYISKIIVQPCNGSTLQKWNAPANLLSPTPLKDIGEK
jgi:hypothetical protein